MNPIQPTTIQDNIVFYDGYCALCNRLVQILLKADSKRRLKFASLQGAYAQKYLPEHILREIDSIVFLQGGKVLIYSSAVIEIARTVGGKWQLFILGRVIPQSMRDAIYKRIARRRYRWFGTDTQCLMPCKEDADRFLE